MKKLIHIEKNVLSGQCKNAFMRIQVGYTAIFLLSGFFSGYAGSQVGFFAPCQEKRWERREFYFNPWFYKDVSISRVNPFFKNAASFFSFKFST